MRATVKSINFNPDIDWIFLLEDSHNNLYHIATQSVYKSNNLPNPLDKQLLDRTDKGTSIVFESTIIGDRNIVTEIFSYC